jgi:UDP-N-acetylmuramoylalanine--D-glutamate ligase
MSPVAPDFLRPLLDRPVAVFGAGVSGEGVVELLHGLGTQAVVYDAKGGTARPEFTAAQAAGHSLVVFSPGFAPEHAWLVAARAAGCVCLGELDFASLFWRGRIVAITGTNGKTTLTEFLTHALRAAGVPALAVGNVGYPFSSAVVAPHAQDTVAVCEVSSFQSETLRHFRAEATLWTNLAEDHLERHPGMGAYFDAKLRLVHCTPSGRFWVGTSVAAWATRLGRALPPETCLRSEGLLPDARLAGTVFAEYPQRENFVLAEAWWRSAGLPEEALLAAARSFTLGRHRLTPVAEVDGVRYWNDSKATNFHAVHGALRRFGRPVILVAGGRAKGGDIRAFATSLRGLVSHLLLIGETAGELAAGAAAAGLPHSICASLPEAVRRGAALARPGDQVLLSPGFASFDMFRNYEDRGERFEAVVRELSAARHPVGTLS